MARKRADPVGLRLRFSEALRRRIERAAENNRHSMNAEIIARLTESFQRNDEEARVVAAIDIALDKALDRALKKLSPAERAEIAGMRAGMRAAEQAARVLKDERDK